MHPDNDRIIQQTKNWISNIVIGLNLCPFAKHAFDQQKISYTVISSKNTSDHLEQLADCFRVLDIDNDIETSLIIFPGSYTTFDSYLELLHVADLFVEDQKYDGTYQLASFHPDYQFADTAKDDASNFTNRSPYPMLHILRENSVEQAVARYPDIEAVPENNIKKCRETGYDTMQAYLDKCRLEP